MSDTTEYMENEGGRQIARREPADVALARILAGHEAASSNVGIQALKEANLAYKNLAGQLLAHFQANGRADLTTAVELGKLREENRHLKKKLAKKKALLAEKVEEEESFEQTALETLLGVAQAVTTGKADQAPSQKQLYSLLRATPNASRERVLAYLDGVRKLVETWAEPV